MYFLGPRPQGQKFFEILWFYWIHLMILEKMRSCLWKLEPGFWTCGWICLPDPSGPNLVSRPQVPRSRYFLRFHNFIGLISWFLRKWGLCLWKLEPGFLTNGLISPLPKALDPNFPKLVFRPQTHFFMPRFIKFCIT